MKKEESNKLPWATIASPFVLLGFLLVWLGLQIAGGAIDDEDKFEVYRVWKKNF